MKTRHVFMLILSCFFAVLISCQNQTEKAELDNFKSMVRVQTQNKEIVREVFAAIDNNNFDKLKELFADDFALTGPGALQPWKAEDIFKGITMHYASFPDWTHNIEELIAEGDKVVVKLTQVGTHKAQYKEINATGKKIINPAISIMTVVNGKVKDWWVIEDNLGFNQQLGMELVLKKE